MTGSRTVATSVVGLDQFCEKGLYVVAACNGHWSFWPWRDLLLFCPHWYLLQLLPPLSVFCLIECRQSKLLCWPKCNILTEYIYFVFYILRQNTAIEDFILSVYYLFSNQSNICLLLIHASSGMVLFLITMIRRTKGVLFFFSLCCPTYMKKHEKGKLVYTLP